MQSYRIASVVLIALALTPNLAECGPARSIALAAQRSSKIPISIRAPFRHSDEASFARGYGKRSQLSSSAGKTRENDLGTIAWDNGKGEVKFLVEPSFARSYGKRSSLNSSAGKLHGNDLGAMAWGNGKSESNFLDNDSSDVTNENIEQVLNESSQSDSVPLEWVANELTLNPGLLKAILYRFVDANKDGLLSSQEFLGTTSESNNSY